MATSTINKSGKFVALYQSDQTHGLRSGGSATLPQTIANFKRVKVYLSSGDGYQWSCEVYNNGGSSVYVVPFGGSCTGTLYAKTARLRIDGAAMSMDRGYSVDVKNNAYPTTSTNSDAFVLIRVEGYYE